MATSEEDEPPAAWIPAQHSGVRYLLRPIPPHPDPEDKFLQEPRREGKRPLIVFLRENHNPMQATRRGPILDFFCQSCDYPLLQSSYVLVPDLNSCGTTSPPDAAKKLTALIEQMAQQHNLDRLRFYLIAVGGSQSLQMACELILSQASASKYSSSLRFAAVGLVCDSAVKIIGEEVVRALAKIRVPVWVFGFPPSSPLPAAAQLLEALLQKSLENVGSSPTANDGSSGPAPAPRQDNKDVDAAAANFTCVCNGEPCEPTPTLARRYKSWVWSGTNMQKGRDKILFRYTQYELRKGGGGSTAAAPDKQKALSDEEDVEECWQFAFRDGWFQSFFLDSPDV